MLDKVNISQKQSILIVLALVIIILGAYWPVKNYEFINYDDHIYLIKNINIQDGITLEGIQWAFSSRYFDLWTPLVYISYMLDYQLFGFRAGGYHWTNVIIHIFNTVLLFSLFMSLTGAMWRSALVAALFAIHPMNVESVAWVAERKNVLSTFFWLLTMLFYVGYVKKPSWKRYLPVLISLAFGLMSKPMLITLPFVLLLIDYWPLDRAAINTPGNNEEKHIFLKKEKLSFLVFEKIPLFVLSVISIFVTIYTPPSNPAPQFLRTVDLTHRINNAIFSYAMYVKKLFWPTDLSIIYLYVDIPMWQLFFSAAFLISITFWVCRNFRKYPYGVVGWFWYLGTMLPVIGIVSIGDHTMADRYAYVTFIGLFIMVAWSTKQISSPNGFFKKMIIWVSILMIFFFALAAYKQVKVWTNTKTLFENAFQLNPNNYFASQIIGQELVKNNESGKALYYYDMALKANPKFWPAYNNKGLILKTIGRHEEALKHFQKAIQVNPFSVEAYHNIGAFYYENRNLNESIKYFLKSVEINPRYVESYNYLGVILVEKENINEGIQFFEKALQIDPNNKNAQKNLKIARERIKN